MMELLRYKIFLYLFYAKQKHLGNKNVRGQSEATLQTLVGATKNFSLISAEPNESKNIV